MVKGRNKYRVCNVRSVFNFDFRGLGVGYGMLRALGPSSVFTTKFRRFYASSVPHSSKFEYFSLGDRLNQKLFRHYFFRRFSTTIVLRSKFFFRLHEYRSSKLRKAKVSQVIVYLRMLASYFRNITLCLLFKFFDCALRRKGAYQDNLIVLFECRLVSITYRLYFFYDISDSLKFLKINPIWSSNFGSFLLHPNYIVVVYDLLCFSPFVKGGIYWLIFRKFLRNSVYSSVPKFIMFSWIFFKFILKRLPEKRNLIFTFPFDFFNFCGKK